MSPVGSLAVERAAMCDAPPRGILLPAGRLLSVALLFAASACAGSGDRPDAPPPSADEVDAVRPLAERWTTVGDSVVLLDLRDLDQFEQSHIPGARWVEWTETPVFARQLPRGQVIYVYCHLGKRTQQVARYLRQHGYDVIEIGRFNVWRQAGGPIAVGTR